MKDIITQLYHCVDENLPVIPLENKAENALFQTLTEEQKVLFEAYQRERFYNTEAERLQLFRYLLSLHRLL